MRAKQEPKTAIGLQACRLDIVPRSPKDADLQQSFEAGLPWWRGGVLPPVLQLDWSSYPEGGEVVVEDIDLADLVPA